MEEATDKQISFMKSLKVNYPNGCTKEQAKELINDHLVSVGKEPAKQEFTTKTGAVKDTSSFYVAYAKDVVIAMIEDKARYGSHSVSAMMTEAIDIIKQAQKEFS